MKWNVYGWYLLLALNLAACGAKFEALPGLGAQNPAGEEAIAENNPATTTDETTTAFYRVNEYEGTGQ